jgi:hypothetical protein
LSADTSVVDSVETIERVLSIPEMTASSDDTQGSSYIMSLSGSDGWRLVVWVREEFIGTRPDRFVPGPRPKRLYGVREAMLSVTLNLFGRRAAEGSPQCWPVMDLIKSLKTAGWRDVSLQNPATDGLMPAQAFKFNDKSLVTLQQPGECVQSVLLKEDPSKH